MAVTEIAAKSLVTRRRIPDTWFISSASFNLYRGCTHNCAYCDGRDERYYVDGQFGRDVAVKTNAPELLRKELDPRRRRVPFASGYLAVGGGVGDSYQPAERTYRLTRSALTLAQVFGHPVHVLTKSALVTRDLDVLTQINRETGVLVSFSFSTVDGDVARIVEPGLPGPSARLAALREVAQAGIPTGVFLLPVLPYLSDGVGQIRESLRAVKEAGAQYALFGGLTMKKGRQRDHWEHVLATIDPGLVRRYRSIYTGDTWGRARGEYYRDLNDRYRIALQSVPLSPFIPDTLFASVLDVPTRAVVVLAHIDGMRQILGRRPVHKQFLSNLYRAKQRPTEETLLKAAGVAPEGMPNTGKTAGVQITDGPGAASRPGANINAEPIQPAVRGGRQHEATVKALQELLAGGTPAEYTELMGMMGGIGDGGTTDSGTNTAPHPADT